MGMLRRNDREEDEDERRDSLDHAREQRKALSCACSHDLPGRCPGRQNFPMEKADEEEERGI